MTHIVTQRFLKCLAILQAEGRVKSARQFALSLDYLPQSLSEINRNRRDVTIELIRRAVAQYDFNPMYLFAGEGPPFLTQADQSDHRVLTVVHAPDDAPQIVHVPASALEGYATKQGDAAWVGTLPTFRLPDEKYHTEQMRSFDVTGDGMEPTLFEGDKVVGHYLAPTQWPTAIKEGFVYVVVTHTNVHIARLYGRWETPSATLCLVVDNGFYEAQELAVKDIQELWYVRVKISPFLPAPTNIENRLLEQLIALQEQSRQQSQLIQSLSTTIEKIAGPPNS